MALLSIRLIFLRRPVSGFYGSLPNLSQHNISPTPHRVGTHRSCAHRTGDTSFRQISKIFQAIPVWPKGLRKRLYTRMRCVYIRIAHCTMKLTVDLCLQAISFPCQYHHLTSYIETNLFSLNVKLNYTFSRNGNGKFGSGSRSLTLYHYSDIAPLLPLFSD